MPDDTTAGRLNGAAKRLNIAMAGTAEMGYRAHALAPLFRLAAPWFMANPDDVCNANPQIRAAHLSRFFLTPLVGKQFPKAVRDRLLRQLDVIAKEQHVSVSKGPSVLRLSPKQLNEILSRVRIIIAPLSAWIQRLRTFVSDVPKVSESDRENQESFEHRRRALILLERLYRLRDCIRGAPFRDDFEVDETFDQDVPPEERDLVGTPMFEETASPHVAGGTFGALRRFLLDCHLRVRSDRCGKAMLAELASRKDEPITGKELQRLLRGSASLGVLRDGISVLPYEDYDGRVVDTSVWVSSRQSWSCLDRVQQM